MAPKKTAPLKTGPKGPVTEGGPMNATKMADYRQRLREEQENALKYLKKKKWDQLETEEMEEKTVL